MSNENTTVIGSLLGLIGTPLGIGLGTVILILGIIALVKTGKREEKQIGIKAVAITAISLGGLWVLINSVIIAAVIIHYH